MNQSNTTINPGPATVEQTQPVLPAQIGFVKGTERLLGLIFCAVVALNFVSAAMRYAGGYAFVGADEVQVYAMLWLIFLAAALAAVHGAHLRMDVMVQNLGPKAMRWRDLFQAALTLVVCAFMAWVSFRFAAEMMTMGQRSDGAGVPMWWVHAAPAVGFLGLAAASCFDLARLCRAGVANADIAQ